MSRDGRDPYAIRRWFWLDWYRYLWADNRGWRNILCRARGHAGVIFYNAGGTEPDMRCRNCREYIG